MPRSEFNLAQAIGGIVSELNTGAPEVKMIPIGDIIPNPANFYRVDMDAIKPLMDSIAMDGLHHYPLVMKHPEEDGKWLLIDGERRYTACKALVEEGNEDFKEIPCTVKEYASTALAELQLILSNSTNRVLSGAELSRQAEKTEMLFYQLKEEGYDFPGRMRDRVAAACNVSATKLAKLKVIRERLVEEYKPMWEQSKLTEQAAYALARMPEELQKRISEIVGDLPVMGANAEAVLSMHLDGWRWDGEGLKCPDGNSCIGEDRFLRHDVTAPYWEEKCGGRTCCMECNQRRRCNTACSKAKDAIKRSDEKEMRTREETRRITSEENKEKTAKNAKRLVRAIDAAGLDDEQQIFWENNWEPHKVGDIRKFAAGIFDDKVLHDALFAPDDLRTAYTLSELLECSTDYLFGLTDELDGGRSTKVEWCDPKSAPVVYEEVVAKFDIGTDKPKKMFAMWDGEDWCFLHGEPIAAKCVGWWPLPEEE